MHSAEADTAIADMYGEYLPLLFICNVLLLSRKFLKVRSNSTANRNKFTTENKQQMFVI